MYKNIRNIIVCTDKKRKKKKKKGFALFFDLFLRDSVATVPNTTVSNNVLLSSNTPNSFSIAIKKFAIVEIIMRKVIAPLCLMLSDACNPLDLTFPSGESYNSFTLGKSGASSRITSFTKL